MTPQGNHSLPVAAWLGLVLAGCSLAFMGVAAIAPRIAADSGLPREAVGWFAGTVWTAGLAASLATGALVSRWGPWAVTRMGLLACAVGLAAMASGHPWIFAIAAVLIGVGQGLEAPAASQLLAHHVAIANRPLYFSLKQTGVQFGAVLASLSMPALALTLGWQAALVCVAVLLILLAALLHRPSTRFRLDEGTDTTRTTRETATVLPVQSWLAVLKRQAGLRRLSIAACAFGATQVCMNAFLVTWMIATRDVALTHAGFLAATAQGAGLVGRPLWGWVASRRRGSVAVLRFLGVLMSACALTLGLWGAHMHDATLALVAALFGLSASGWNGVFLSEVAASGGDTPVAAATAAAMVPLYAGLIAGPVLFAAISSAADMSAGFVMLAMAAAGGAWWLPSARR